MLNATQYNGTLVAKLYSYLVAAGESKLSVQGENLVQKVQDTGRAVIEFVPATPDQYPTSNCTAPPDMDYYQPTVTAIQKQFDENRTPIELRIGNLSSPGNQTDRTCVVRLTECTDLGGPAPGQITVGYYKAHDPENATIAFLNSSTYGRPTPATVAHEISHIVQYDHPVEVDPFLDSNELQALCHDGHSSLIYQSTCINAGFSPPNQMIKEMGLAELTSLQTRMVNQSEKARIRETAALKLAAVVPPKPTPEPTLEPTDEPLEDAASDAYNCHSGCMAHILSTGARATLDTLISAGITRMTWLTPNQREVLAAVGKVVTYGVQAALLYQGGYQLMATATLTALNTGLFGKTMKALAEGMGPANAGMVLHELLKGNSFPALQMGLGIVSKRAGDALGQVLNLAIEHFKPLTKEQQEEHLRRMTFHEESHDCMIPQSGIKGILANLDLTLAKHIESLTSGCLVSMIDKTRKWLGLQSTPAQRNLSRANDTSVDPTLRNLKKKDGQSTALDIESGGEPQKPADEIHIELTRRPQAAPEQPRETRMEMSKPATPPKAQTRAPVIKSEAQVVKPQEQKVGRVKLPPIVPAQNPNPVQNAAQAPQDTGQGPSHPYDV